MRLKSLALATSWVLFQPAAQAALVKLDRGGYVLDFDCELHSAVRYEYSLNRDMGSAPRPREFYLDPDLPPHCQGQWSTLAYSNIEPGWDRGHLVTSNHMDSSPTMMKRANYMSNIVPQARNFNQGIWLEAENIAECYRDLGPVHVVGGVTYSDPSNDYFLESHGIPTPDFFWKVIIREAIGKHKAQAIAWLIPNSNEPGELDDYIVSIHELEERLGRDAVAIEANGELKEMKPFHSWRLPADCRFD